MSAHFEGPVRAWNRFFFEPWPASRLATARIALMVALLLRFGRRDFTRFGRLPEEFYRPQGPFLWFDWPQPTEAVLHGVWLGFLVCATCALIGLATRRSVLGSLVALTVLLGAQSSFGKVSHGSLVALWSLLLLSAGPSGDVLSVDAWWRRRRAVRMGVPREVLAHPPSGRYTWPVRLAMLHLALFYFFSGWTKLMVSGVAWADGDALRSFLLYKGEPLGVFIAGSLWACRLLSIGTLGLELTFPLGVLSRHLRWPFLLGGVGMHLGIGWTMSTWFYGTLMVYLLFVDWPRLGGIGVRALARLHPLLARLPGLEKKRE